VFADIYPAGVFSHLLSDRHRGVLASPTFRADRGTLWLRVRGSKARARYVVRNYPRTGTVYPKAELSSDTDQWVGWKLDYWKGDTLHVEITTDADQPVETANVERSWFGAGEVLVSKDPDGPAPPSSAKVPFCPADAPPPGSETDLAAFYAARLRRCVEAWRLGEMSDDEAGFLSPFLKKGWLPNRLQELPAVAPLVAEYRRLESELPAPTRAPGLLEGFAFDQPVLVRGNHRQPGPAVPRRFLEAIDPMPYSPGPARSGRRALAESIVAPANPLTSRVIVNRLWSYCFGEGLVPTPDNFGRLGEPPSHPELLDYLAARFQSEGGSIKKMIRLLVTARAFRLGASPSNLAAARDPSNRWRTHYSARRLDAEAIRDGMIALTGKLDAKLGGETADAGTYRRSVYLKVVRNSLDPLLSAFDFPAPSATRGRRDATNVPAQALALLNGPLVARWAGDWAARTLRELPAATPEERVRRMFAEAMARNPTGDEVARSLAFLRGLSTPAEARDGSVSDSSWCSFAQALLNAKEFIYVR
jgi:hypothetical protein